MKVIKKCKINSKIKTLVFFTTVILVILGICVYSIKFGVPDPIAINVRGDVF